MIVGLHQALTYLKLHLLVAQSLLVVVIPINDTLWGIISCRQYQGYIHPHLSYTHPNQKSSLKATLPWTISFHLAYSTSMTSITWSGFVIVLSLKLNLEMLQIKSQLCLIYLNKDIGLFHLKKTRWLWKGTGYEGL